MATSVSWQPAAVNVQARGDQQPQQRRGSNGGLSRPQNKTGLAARMGSARSRHNLGVPFVATGGERAQETRTAKGIIYPRIMPNTAASPPQQTSRSPSRTGGLRVAVDVDEVLAQFLLALNEYCLEEHDMDYKVSDFALYDFKTVWNCTQDVSNDMVHSFFESRHFHEGVQVIPGALESLQRLQSTCDLMVVTSRQHVIQEPTMRWLDTNFPDVFEEVHFGNHWAKEGKSRKKSEICRDIGADVLIDDNPGYALDCAEAGIQVLLFDWDLSYRWAKTENNGPIHPNITRVSDWAAVEVALALLAARTAV